MIEESIMGNHGERRKRRARAEGCQREQRCWVLKGSAVLYGALVISITHLFRGKAPMYGGPALTVAPAPQILWTRDLRSTQSSWQ